MHAQATHCLVQVPAWRSVPYRAHRRHRWPDHETAHRFITSEQALFNFGRTGMCPAFGAFGCRRPTAKEQNCEANDRVLGHFLGPDVGGGPGAALGAAIGGATGAIGGVATTPRPYGYYSGYAGYYGYPGYYGSPG